MLRHHMPPKSVLQNTELEVHFLGADDFLETADTDLSKFILAIKQILDKRHICRTVTLAECTVSEK